MKGSLVIVGFFALGIITGLGRVVSEGMIPESAGMYVLYALMFLVGVTVGYDRELLRSLRRTNGRILLVPLATIFGTLGGCALASLLLPQWSVAESMAVGSGFGYYSLSGIFITQYKGATLGTIALISNIMREVIALLATPLLLRWFGRLAPISVAGATSMDTALPIITQYSGRDYVLVAISHGIIVDLSVPLLVAFFCGL